MARDAAGIDGLLSPLAQFGFELLLNNGNEHFRYLETSSHGYGLMTFNATHAIGEIRFNDKSKLSDSTLAWKGIVVKDKNKWD